MDTRFSNWINVYRLWKSNKKIILTIPKQEWPVAALFGRFAVGRLLGPLSNGEIADTEQHGK